jgi:hypothetical protein
MKPKRIAPHTVSLCVGTTFLKQCSRLPKAPFGLKRGRNVEWFLARAIELELVIDNKREALLTNKKEPFATLSALRVTQNNA